MKDEVLYPYAVDNYEDYEAIPRYDIALPSGQIIYEGVQLILRNTVAEPGTPLNKQNLLSDDTSRAFALDPETSTPDEVFNVIRSFSPKIKVQYLAGGTVYVKNLTTSQERAFPVPSNGIVTVDIFEYATYEVWGTLSATSRPETVVVDTAKVYSIQLTN